MTNVVNINDYRKPSYDFDDITDIQIDNLLDMIKEMEEKKTDIQKTVDAASIEFQKNMIATMYNLGADPNDEMLSHNMIMVSMLFSAALTEYFTNEYAKTYGESNSMYYWLEQMTEELLS